MKLLLIEDDEALAAALSRGLADEGYEVVTAHDGLTGLSEARSGTHDLVISDIMLPHMNGFQICRTLRAEGVTTPILVLTAKNGEYDEAEALEEGADDFLSKPFSFVVLLARLAALVRRSEGHRPARLEIGSLVLDPAARIAKRDEREIQLTQREFDLLAALMEANGAAVDKRALLAKVWGDDFDGEANIVEVYIGYLRKKVDVPFGVNSIETVRGIGYRIAAT